MEIKELEKILKLCRKQGVNEISFEGLVVKFGDLPRKDLPSDDSEEIPEDMLSDEQLMFAHVTEGR